MDQEVEVRHEPALAWLPFGAGQFQNGNSGLAWFFMISEIGVLGLGGAAGITALAVPGTEHNLYSVMNYMTYIAATSFVGLAVMGILEANLNYVPSHREHRQRELPPDLDLDLILGAG